MKNNLEQKIKTNLKFYEVHISVSGGYPDDPDENSLGDFVLVQAANEDKAYDAAVRWASLAYAATHPENEGWEIHIERITDVVSDWWIHDADDCNDGNFIRMSGDIMVEGQGINC